MSVIVEFTLADEAFRLGKLVQGPPDVFVELEKIVPTGSGVIPFLWVRGADYERFEQNVADSGDVVEFVALDRLDDWVLYRIDWTTNHDDLLEGINDNDGVILDAHSNDGWVFRLRFPNHDDVSQFYNFCTQKGITIHIDRSYTLTEKTEFGHQFDLSQEQREALILGLRRGYFDTPSQLSLDEIAEELGISQQATSSRIRRGTEQVLREALLSSAADFDRPTQP